MSMEFGVWVAGLLTLGIFSFLYKDNVFYKITEAIFVGCSAGYWAVIFFWDSIYRKFWLGVFPDEGDEADLMLWGGAILGVLMLARLIPKIGWISRWPLSFIVGATAGLYMMLYFVSNGLNQVASTMAIPRDAMGDIDWSALPDTIIIAVGVVTGLIYFFFSKEHKGAFGAMARVGIWFLMATFGAHFGYTVMSRMSLLIGRVDFIFRDWFGLIG